MGVIVVNTLRRFIGFVVQCASRSCLFLYILYVYSVSTNTVFYARFTDVLVYYLQHTLIGLSSVLRPRQHSIGYMGDGFYRSKKNQPTVSK